MDSNWRNLEVPSDLLARIERLRDVGLDADTAIALVLERLHARIAFELTPAAPDYPPAWVPADPA